MNIKTIQLRKKGYPDYRVETGEARICSVDDPNSDPRYGKLFDYDKRPAQGTAGEEVEGLEAGDEAAVDAGTPEAVTTLQDIVAGKYDSTPSDDVQDMLEQALEALEALEALGIVEQYDDLLGAAAEKYVELADKEGF